jgi:hypothetical protein
MFTNGIGGIVRHGINSDGEGSHENICRDGLKKAAQRRLGNWRMRPDKGKSPSAGENGRAIAIAALQSESVERSHDFSPFFRK